MKLHNHISHLDFVKLKEVEKARIIGYLLSTNTGKLSFTIDEIIQALDENHYPKPNKSRLRSNLSSSKWFLKTGRDSFKLSSAARLDLCKSYPNIEEKDETIIHEESVLPEALYKPTKRGYVIKLAEQINASFEVKCYDATAVLMRRLTEVLVILCFRKDGIEASIKDSSNSYFPLSKIIDVTLSKNHFNLQKESRGALHEFRELGNLSAHKIEYNCRHSEIKKELKKFRVLVEELLYKGGLLS